MLCLLAVLLVLVSGLMGKKKKKTINNERTPFQVKVD
jgi:hypothetical protein